jgi:hypothetical protein
MGGVVVATKRYAGAQWPTEDWVTDSYDLRSTADAHAQLQGTLRDEYARAVQAIRDDVDLSDSGKQKKLHALAASYREHATVKQMRASLDTLGKREKALREKLTSRPTVDHDKLSPYAAGRLLETERRTIQRFEAATPEQQREQVRSALARNDHEFLHIILHERLLDAVTARRVESALLRAGDVDSYRELQHLVGRMDLDGTPDALTGCLPVAGQALDLFLAHLDQAIGVDPAVAERAVTIDAAIKGDAIVLTEAQGHDVQLFRAARDRAAAEGKTLRIEGDAGSGDIEPGQFAPITADGRGDG